MDYLTVGWESWRFLFRGDINSKPIIFITDCQAMLFMSPSLSAIRSEAPVEPRGEFTYYNKIQQSDLVPTISSLLGWPIPRNNLGVLVQSFIGFWKG
jgi:hypothetical protein